MAPEMKALVVGAGNRGSGYSMFALEHPDKLRIVGVADPRSVCRQKLANTHNISNDFVFKDWNDAVNEDKFADCVIIATPDILHKEPAIAFAKKGYHILLEKPMAVNEDDCKEIVKACRDNGIILTVCHVLRYLPLTRRIKQIIDSGVIGDLVSMELTEPVGYWHFAHSFVRGNWRKESDSSFSLLAKSCHDVDLIYHWMAPAKCVKVASFGHLSHFTKENKPEGAASRCLDCSVEEQCPYSAKKIYLTGNKGWPVNVVSPDAQDIESVTEALQTGPYGRCVYDCDNDVISNQVVNFEFEGGKTATFTMIAFTEKVCKRQVRIYCSRGDIQGSLDEEITVHNFSTRKSDVYNSDEEMKAAKNSKVRGHGGADYILMKNFVQAVADKDPTRVMSAEETLQSHLLVFAAERARKANQVVTLIAK